MSKRKFIQTVPFGSGSYNLSPKTDYMAIAPTGMFEKGYDCEYIILKPRKAQIEYEKIRKSIRKEINLKIFDSFFAYFNYLRKQKEALLFAHDRVPSALICFLFGKRNIFMSHQSRLPLKWWQRQAFKFCARRFDGIRVVNLFEKEELIKIGVKPHRISIIPHNIDIECFSQTIKAKDKGEIHKKYKIRRDDICIAFLAFVRKFKNVDTVLKALKVVVKDYPTARLIIIGTDGLANENHPTIVEQAEKLGIEEHITITGILNHKEIVKVLNICSLGINSSFHEGQCLAVYEMACAGLPLCLSSIGSFTSVFKDSVLFHEPTDYIKLTDNIKKYLKDKELAKEHVEKNKKVINKDYTYEIVKKKLCDFIEGKIKRY